jgi:hypothetical protein
VSDADRLEKTPKIFLENPFFFDDIGDVRPVLEFALSLVVVFAVLTELSLRILLRIST